MKPAVCCICHRHLELGKGELVAFADYEPLPKGLVGHPAGLEWFCAEHLEAGRALQHWTRHTAIAELRRTGGRIPDLTTNPLKTAVEPSKTPPPGRR